MDQWRMGVMFNLMMMQADTLWTVRWAEGLGGSVAECNRSVAEEAIVRVAHRFGIFRPSTEEKLLSFKENLTTMIAEMLPTP